MIRSNRKPNAVVPVIVARSNVFLLLLSFCYRSVLCEQVTLLDTTTETSLNWTRYQASSSVGWIEETYTNFDEHLIWRAYVVCDVTNANVSNWLWTPFISRSTANRLYIEIKFTIRDCAMFPGYALSCKETFSLMFYEFDVATRGSPPWKTEGYKLIDRIAIREEKADKFSIDTKSIAVSKHGVYFAFRDQGACISLLSIKIYHIVCPAVTLNLARFAQTATGKDFSSIVKVEGECVENAEVSGTAAERPTYVCKSDGKWQLADGSCRCKAGYEPDFKKQQCLPCPAGKYKAESSNANCSVCPEHSKAPDIATSECRCNAHYFRAAKDPKSMPCTQPPSAPLNLTVDFIDQTTLSLEWLAPSPQSLGGRDDLHFRIECDLCTNSVTYTPARDLLNTTKVTIGNLTPTTTYRFDVYAENGVSYLTAGVKNLPANHVFIRVTTDSIVPSIVTNVRVLVVKSQEIELAWDEAQDGGGSSSSPSTVSDVEIYEVRVYPRLGLDQGNATSHLTKELSITISGLQQKTEYGLQVRAKTSNGWGAYSPALYQTTGQLLAGNNAYMGELEGFRLRLVAGGIVAIVVILAAFIVLAVLFFKSRTADDCNKKQPSDCDTLEYRNGDVTTPLFTSMGNGSTRSYIDPHTYEDPNQAVREFAREIDASTITIESIIGGGEFGDVCKGKLRIGLGIQDITVAIKTLKVGSSDKAKCDFLTEASIMGQFEHPNVIFLQGVVTKSNPVMIITEFMENGSLDTFLRNNEAKFQVVELVAMLRGIASGMHYLSEMNYVHRDLAARNVLVNSQLVCKIADFGLSREIESANEGAYTTRGGKIPVRWTAPEAIAFRKFTSASDVWSMGIVCWEVISYGERPYWNWSNQDVIKSIEKGYRLPPPMDSPEIIYQLMLDCWQTDRLLRPNFFTIVKTLEKLIRMPDLLRKTVPSTTSTKLQNLMPQTFNCSPYLWQAAGVGDSTDTNGANSGAALMSSTTSSTLDATLPIHDIPLSEFNVQQAQQQQQQQHSSSMTPSTITNPNAAWILHAPDYCSTPQLSTLINNQKKTRKKPTANAIYTLDRTWASAQHHDYAQSYMLAPPTNQQQQQKQFRCTGVGASNNNNNNNSTNNQKWLQAVTQSSAVSSIVSPSLNCSDSGSGSASGSASSSSSSDSSNNSTPQHHPSSSSASTWLSHLNSNSVPEVLQITSIDDWLKSIKMSEYVNNFRSFGYQSMDQIFSISAKDLNSIGVSSLTDQKRILNSLQIIQAQLQVLQNRRDGFLV